MFSMFAIAGAAIPLAVNAAPDQVLYVPGSAQKICQLTGELDFDPSIYSTTLNRTWTTFGIKGTDLGFSFEQRTDVSGTKKTVFLFGDTIGALKDNLDAIAYSDDTSPDDCISLQFVAQANLPPYYPPIIYSPPTVSGYPPGVSPINHEGLGVPSHGFSANRCPNGAEKLYVFFSSFKDPNFPSNEVLSLLAYSCDEAQSFQYLYEFSRQNFINGSSAIVDSADIPGLPQTSGPGLLVWGSGDYRESDVFLAFIPLDRVEDKTAWRYYRDPTSPGANAWVQDQSLATPVIRTLRSPQDLTPCVGELSVTWNPFLKKWLLLYNCNKIGKASEVRAHVADLPWGPWSDFITSDSGGPSSVLFDPERDGAFERFMHKAGVDDGLWDTLIPSKNENGGRKGDWGDPYAPYVISRFTTGDDKSTTIYYTLSAWNPYQVMLMKSKLRLQRPPVANAGHDQTVSADNRCLGTVTLDGRGSSDPDEDTLTYVWTGPFGTVTGATPTITLPLGTVDISLEVNDGVGGTATDKVSISVVDTTAPALSVTLTPDAFWPPKHMLVPVTAEIQVSDNCDPSPAVRLTSLLSSEPDNGLGDGDTANDVQAVETGTDDRSFLVRSERSGTGVDRVYTATYSAQDGAGNETTEEATVTVSHDSR